MVARFAWKLAMEPSSMLSSHRTTIGGRPDRHQPKHCEKLDGPIVSAINLHRNNELGRVSRPHRRMSFFENVVTITAISGWPDLSEFPFPRSRLTPVGRDRGRFCGERNHDNHRRRGIHGHLTKKDSPMFGPPEHGDPIEHLARILFVVGLIVLAVWIIGTWYSH